MFAVSGIAESAKSAVRGSWPVPKAWRAKKLTSWYPGALCIHQHESSDWHIHNEPYAGGFQFMLGTWMRAGGSPSTWFTATPREQFYRAYMIWKQDGGSWREWPNTSRMCGVA